MPRRCRFWRPCNVPRFIDFRSDSPLNFMCFRPPYQRVFDDLYEATLPVCGLLTDVCCRDTDVYHALCHSRGRSGQPCGLLNEDKALPVQQRAATGCVLLPDDDKHRLTDERPSEPRLTASDFLQRHPGMAAVRERSQAELFRTLAVPLDVDRCIAEFCWDDVSAEDDNSNVHHCPHKSPCQ
jgi:hypothetical protein